MNIQTKLHTLTVYGKKQNLFTQQSLSAACEYKCIVTVPAVVDVEVGSHDRSGEQGGMSPCHGINHGSYRPPVDMSGNTHNVRYTDSMFKSEFFFFFKFEDL